MNMFAKLRKAQLDLEKTEAERDLWIKRWNTVYNYVQQGAADSESNEEAYAFYQVKAAMEQVKKYTDGPGGSGGGAKN